MLEKRIAKVVKTEIYRRYPEMRGAEPAVEEQVAPQPVLRRPAEQPVEAVGRKFYLLTFKKQLRAQDGAIITQVVRVTTDDEGRIIKVVMSR